MRGSAARLIFPALVVLALVGVVAVAATGSTSKGTSDVRPPSATLLDTMLSLGFLAVAVGAVLLAYGLTQRKAIRRELASRRYPRTTIVGFVAFVLVFTLFSYWRLRNWEVKPVDRESDPAFPGIAPVPRPPGADSSAVTYEPQFTWLPIVVVLGLATSAVAAYVIAQRRARPTARDESLSEELAVVLDETLDDLRAESDPRRAVIAAYARLERVLAAHGLPRRSAETPEEYLTRILRNLEIDAWAIARLTELFSQAKFSQHVVDRAMKEEAIEALEHVRDELRRATAAEVEAPGAELATTGASS